MMDEMLVKKSYFALITSTSPAGRKAALEALRGIDSQNVRILAGCGEAVCKALDDDAAVPALEGAIKDMQGLEMLDYWYSFIEDSAAALLAKSLSPGSKGKRMLYGLRMMRLVTSAGFPISSTSLRLVRAVGEKEKSLSLFAFDILKEARPRG